MGPLKATKPLPPEAERSLMASFPVRTEVPWDVLDGRVVLALAKRFTGVDRFLQRFVPGPTVAFVALDAVGTEAWLLCDGTRTGKDVAEGIREKFGPDAEPAEGRAAAFLASLMAKGVLRAFDRPLPVKDPNRGFTPDRGFRLTTCPRCERRHPLKDEGGARYVCPGCGKLSRVPAGPG